MIEFVSFGIIVDDIVYPDGRTQMGVLGGGGPQTLWGTAAARASGTCAGLVAGVGADLERAILAPLVAAQIDLRGLRVTEHPTPRAWQVLEADGRRTQVWRVPGHTLGAQLARRWDLLPEAYRQARWVHWGIHPDELDSLPFAQELTARGMHVSLEPFKGAEHPLGDGALRDLLAACAVFSPNEAELGSITGCADYRGALLRLRDLGAAIVAVRRGAAGADVWDLRAGRGVRVPSVPTTVVDVVGAGNAFCGALIARLDEGIAPAACHAVAAAAYMVEQVGLPPGLPDPADYARRVAFAWERQTALRLEGDG